MHFCWKARVADGEHLVYEQDVRVGFDEDGEAEPDPHARGVVLELQLGELAELGELDHAVGAHPGLLRGEPHHHAVEQDVVAGRELRVEADAQLDEGGDPPGDPDRAAVGGVDAREQLQERRLAGAVAAGDAEELARPDVERDVVEGAELPVLDGAKRVQDPLLEGLHAVDRARGRSSPRRSSSMALAVSFTAIG